MTVGFKLGSITDEVGTADFLHAFFSTVSANLEPAGWGSRFPVLLNQLYQGQLHQTDAESALSELGTVEIELARLTPQHLVWDIDNRGARPPWGDEISTDITNLSNYFVTSTGRSLIPMIRECLLELKEVGGVMKVVTY